MALKPEKCTSCGRKMRKLPIREDGVTTDKWIPLDLVAPCYLVSEVGGDLVAIRDRATHVSHFSTCPQASSHSRSRKEACSVGKP